MTTSSRDEVWIYVTSTGEIQAYDSQEQAVNASVDDPGDAWIELVTIQGATGGRVAPERAENAPVRGSRETGPQTGAQRIHVPTSLGRDAPYWNPWSGGAA